MNRLVLLHHVVTADGVEKVAMEDCPPITEVMVSALRSEVLPQLPGSHAMPTIWHHCDNGAWSAAVDLFRTGCREDAIGLADLLAWCDARFTRRVEGCWEIRREGGVR